MKYIPAILALSAAVLLAGCGGGGSESGTGRATFVVNWPEPNRLIPAAANSIKVEIRKGSSSFTTKVVPRPAQGGQTSTTFEALPIGSLTAIATAYPSADGTGTPQATGSAPMTINADQNTQITITMNTTIARIDVTSAGNQTIAVGETVQLTASAKDAAGNVVLIAPGNLQWSSGNAPVATVDANGLVSGASNGSATITVRETESGVTASSSVTVGTGVGGIGGGVWPKFRGDLQNTGRSTAVGAIGSLSFGFPTGGEITTASPVTAADGTVYIGSTDGKFYAISPNGSQKWVYQTGARVDSGPTIGSDGTVYFGSGDANLYALNPDGSKKWSFASAGPLTSSPAIGTDGTIYFGGAIRKFYALNQNGTQKWVFEGGDTFVSSPALASDGTIYVGNYDKKVYALNPNGTQKWAFATGGAVTASPAIGTDGTIYVGSWDNNLYALNPSGTVKWSFNAGSVVVSSAAIAQDGTLYFGANDGKLHAVSPTGTSKWSYTTGGTIASSPAIGGDGAIYFGSGDSKVYVLNPDGTLRWSFTANGPVDSSPAFGPDGTMYVGSRDSKLYAIR
jgi:outer membrane protein assembly factor BamB